MANLEGLDQAALESRLSDATSYDERAAIRKALRELKKSKGVSVGGVSKRGTSQYNRFAGRPKDTKIVQQHFVPSTTTKSPQPLISKSPVTTPPPQAQPVTSVRTPTSPIYKKEEIMRDVKEEKVRDLMEDDMRGGKEEEIKVTDVTEETVEEEIEVTDVTEETVEEEIEVTDVKEENVEEEIEVTDVKEENVEEEIEVTDVKEENVKEEIEVTDVKEENVEEEIEVIGVKEEDMRDKEEVSVKEDTEENEEEPYSPPPSPVDEDIPQEPETSKEEWVLVDETKAKELEKEAEEIVKAPPTKTILSQDETDGSAPFGVQLRNAGRKPPVAKPTSDDNNKKAEFQSFKLRKTASTEGEKKSSSTKGTQDFGIKLKTHQPNESINQSNLSSRQPAKSSATPTNQGGAPKTLADYQRLSNRSKPSTPSTITSSTNKGNDLQALLAYVNASLQPRPPISSAHALYQMCKRPSNLCKLINKSVRGTVDLRALTKTPPPNASSYEKEEATEENMTLVVESARAIGCSITEGMEVKLAEGDPTTIDKFLVDLIKARVVHMPGMEDEPASTFRNLTLLMEKLGISVNEDNVDVGQEEPLTWREKDSERLREHYSKQREEEKPADKPVVMSSWKEERSKKTPEIDLEKPSLDANLSYEERAALRRAERERKRKEREALATPK